MFGFQVLSAPFVAATRAMLLRAMPSISSNSPPTYRRAPLLPTASALTCAFDALPDSFGVGVKPASALPVDALIFARFAAPMLFVPALWNVPPTYTKAAL